MVETPNRRPTLNDIIHRHFPEERVYRIDHFLGKEAVQNLMIFRFSNTVLEPVWNRHYVRGVQITMAEDFGVEGRGSFYDGVGTLRDVVQNHLLQVLALLAMEPPVSEDPDALRDERVKVLRAVRALTPDDLVRGQYAGYRDEPGVAADSDTETFAAIRLEVDSWRWAGVPWIIRAGKGLGFDRDGGGRRIRPPASAALRRRRRQTRPEPVDLPHQTRRRDHLVDAGEEAGTGDGERPVELHLGHDRTPGRDAYDRLLGDALRGDPGCSPVKTESWRRGGSWIECSPTVDPSSLMSAVAGARPRPAPCSAPTGIGSPHDGP